jgi:TnpA family transposase
MARRGLLNDAERTRLFEAPSDGSSLIRLYSLSDADRDFVLSKRGARNQLRMAVQIRLLRYPGFGLRLENEPPTALIQFLAQQIGAPWPVFRDYARRDGARKPGRGRTSDVGALAISLWKWPMRNRSPPRCF